MVIGVTDTAADAARVARAINYSIGSGSFGGLYVRTLMV